MNRFDNSEPSAPNRHGKISRKEKIFQITCFVLLGLMMACGKQEAPSVQKARSKAPADVLGITWQWVSTVTPKEKTTVQAPERYTLLLTDKGKAQVQFDCNRGGGEYQISVGKLSFSPLMSTRMACPEDTHDALFMRDLSRVASFFVEDGELFLGLPYDSGTLRFRKAQ